MTRASSPRFGSSKGISTVIGTIFLVLTVFVISTNIFLWTITQNTLYNQAVKESYQKDTDRLNEKIMAFNANYSASAGKVQVKAELKNAGSLSVQIITLWVLDTTQKKYNVTDLRGQNINLNPGDSRILNMEVTIPGATSASIFNAWVVTARGNTVPLEKEQTLIALLAELAQGLGSMALDFYKFRYFKYETSTKLANYPDGISSFNVPSKTDIAFGVVLTNLDPSKQTITLNKYSQIWIFFPKTGITYYWYIVNVAANGTITTPYSPITIEFGDTKLIVFASGVAGSLTSVSITASAVENLPCALNLLLLGKIGTQDYGQNIPFVSLYVYKT